MQGEEFSENESKGQEIWADCEQCSRPTRHLVRTSVEARTADAIEHENGIEEDIEWLTRFEIIQCRGCEWLSFRKAFVHPQHDEDYYGPVVTLYPARQRGLKMVSHHERLPEPVGSVYREAHFALTNDQLFLAGVGIRMLVELVCREKEAKGRDLKDKIEDLVAQAILPHDSARIFHGCRWLGNDAAHQGVRPTNDQLLAAMQAVEHLLATVWLLKLVADVLPKEDPRSLRTRTESS